MKQSFFPIIVAAFLLTCEKFDKVTYVKTLPVTSITGNTATLNGTIVDPGKGIRECGHLIWKSGFEDMTTRITVKNIKTGSFSSVITGLEPGTTYAVKAFANDGGGDVFGEKESFATRTTSKILPVLTTFIVTSITSSSAVSGGNISNDGGSSITARGVCWSTNENPDINDSQTLDGSGIGSYTSYIEGLSDNTTYYVRAYAINSFDTAYGNQNSFLTLCPIDSLKGSITDIDGNTYKTAKIGDQWWMVQNLKTTKLSNGIEIPNVKEDSAWENLVTPAYCWYDNNIDYKSFYGALYNYYAVNIGKLCPSNWHVPTDIEWITLIDYFGGDSVAGGILKEGVFDALQGGTRFVQYGQFYGVDDVGIFWSSTSPYTISINKYNNEVFLGSFSNPWNGFSVRCIKD